jgi:hypothetical protein
MTVCAHISSREQFTAKLAQELDPKTSAAVVDAAAAVVDAMIATVLKRKAELEANGGGCA